MQHASVGLPRFAKLFTFSQRYSLHAAVKKLHTLKQDACKAFIWDGVGFVSVFRTDISWFRSLCLTEKQVEFVVSIRVSII